MKLAALACLTTLTLFATALEYRSVSVDQAGQLHVVPGTGKEILPAKLPHQVAFDSPRISPDRRTVGWLVLYSHSNNPGAQFAGKLVLYRAGRVLHRISTEQTFWDWQFQDGGKRVAYSTGPTHGGAAECVLRDVDSGRVVARFSVRSGGEPPAWARSLRR